MARDSEIVTGCLLQTSRVLDPLSDRPRATVTAPNTIAALAAGVQEGEGVKRVANKQ